MQKETDIDPLEFFKSILIDTEAPVRERMKAAEILQKSVPQITGLKIEIEYV